METQHDAAEARTFRPAKRRKFTRNRRASDNDGSKGGRVEMDSPDNDSDAVDAPVSKVLRLRKNKSRKNGIEFSNARTRSSQSPPPSSVVPAATDTDAERLKAISDRFVAHSGQVVDVDRHMVAYIESEMAKRRLGQALPGSSNYTSSAQSSGDEDRALSERHTLQRQPATLGKIHEIDLGKDASLRNQERTELAMRRARGEQIPAEEPAVKKKPRLGRNGKPRRGPKRRNSEDVKRDQLVEQVLHESRLEIYDEPDAENHEDSLDADERIAERFRQDFMDAKEARQRNRTAGQPKPPTLKPGEQVQRGPKLGGSRSARAAMREQQEKAMKK